MNRIGKALVPHLRNRGVAGGFSVVLTIMFCFPVLGQYDALSVERYIQNYKDWAIEEMHRSGIPASIKLAQAIIESGAGTSLLAREAKNHFGIKCHTGWQGDTYQFDDDQKNECFRKYASVRDSYIDHSEFLRNRPRYASLFTIEPTDYVAWARGLKACGYATNPRYAELLIKCIEDYDLHQWDLDPKDRQRWFAQQNQWLQESKQNHAEDMGSDDQELSLQDRVFEVNGVKCVEILPGETLAQLATAYRMSLRRLMRYNEIHDAATDLPARRIYLEPKRIYGEAKEHRVQAGETMFDIAHLHAIQLASLYERNKMILGSQPDVGEIIFLRGHRDTPPRLAQPVRSAPDATAPEAANTSYHVVRPGDTLFSISKKYNITIEELQRINNLSSTLIRPGIHLRIRP